MKKSKLIKNKYKELKQTCKLFKGEFEYYKSRYFEELKENKLLSNKLKLITDLITGEIQENDLIAIAKIIGE